MVLKDKVALVTGAASGIGLAVATRFAAEGAKVLLADLDLAKAQAAAGQLGADGAAEGVRCDVASQSEVEQACERAVARFGRLDIAVNNAGLMTFTPLRDLTEAEWLRVLGVDLLGAFYVTKQLL